MKNNMRILILGASGNLGRLLFRHLSAVFPQAELLGAVRPLHYHFEGVKGMQRNRSIVFDVLKGNWSDLGKVDIVINCLGSSKEKTKDRIANDIQAIENILANRASIGNPAIIQVSAFGAGRKTSSAFLRAKAQIEKLILQQEHTWVIRPSCVCTKGMHMTICIRQLRQRLKWTNAYIFLPRQFLQMGVFPIAASDFAEIIEQVIRKKPRQRIIEAVGDHHFSIENLLQMAGIRPISIVDCSIYFLRWFSRYLLKGDEQHLLNSESYIRDYETEMLIGHKFLDTKIFWQEELSPTRAIKSDFSSVFA